MHHAYIDKFAYQDSPVHRLDSRVKFAAVVIFTAAVISLPSYAVGILACYAIGPFAILVTGRVPVKFALKHILVVSPFIVVLALSSPIYDKAIVIVEFGPLSWQMTRGWLQCFSILGKFTVTMLALIGLVSTTRFSDLLAGLEKLGIPKVLIVQLGFLYRYIFVLIEDAQHILRARTGRKLRNLGARLELKTAAAMIGSLFIRSLDTAERVSIAMQGRGFDGRFRTLSEMKIRRADIIFCVSAGGFILLLHFFVRPILL